MDLGRVRINFSDLRGMPLGDTVIEVGNPDFFALDWATGSVYIPVIHPTFRLLFPDGLIKMDVTFYPPDNEILRSNICGGNG